MDAFEPIHGVLLAEGEDISAGFRPHETETDSEVLAAIANAHPSDTTTDVEKDCIEFELVRRCVRRGIPYLGICRGSQILNIVAGGSILMDIEMEIGDECKHIDYSNYDGHRHPISVVRDTPLARWFDGADELQVNSYHHQGIKRLATRFEVMGRSPDGLVEGFYDPKHFDPEEGKFLIGLQFHPERMQNTDKALKGEKATYEYPGCPRPYEDFVRAATAYRKRCLVGREGKSIEVKEEEDMVRRGPVREQQKDILKSFELASKMYHCDEKKKKLDCEKEVLSRGSRFLEDSTRRRGYSKEDLDRLIRSGATVHGTRLLYDLLYKTDEKKGSDDIKIARRRFRIVRPGVSDWHSFCGLIQQAEKYLDSLRGTSRMGDALTLITNMADSCTSATR